MDLRTKLVFALVAVALGSMLALGGFTYRSARSLLKESALQQFDGLAESKKESVERLISGWHERVQLIASRTQLRLTLREHNRNPRSEAAARIHRILSDALNSAKTIRSLAVFDQAGLLVASASRETDVEITETPVPPPPVGELSEYQGIFFSLSGEPRLVFAASLALGGPDLGVLRATLSGEELRGVTQNPEGLGETGEVMIVVRDASGAARVLHPVRHQEPVGRGPLWLQDSNDPGVLALGGVEDHFTESVVDYRGEAVWAATRFLPETGWGLVVKRDEAEQRAPIVEFRDQLMRLGLTLAAFAILLGTLLGLRFAIPIHDLADVAQRIRGGELGARAVVKAEDEIGLLTRTFNQMADELGNQMSELREFHKYFDVALGMLCIAGTDGYFKRINPAFERTLGFTPDELLSKPFYDFIHPDDIADTQNEIDQLAKGIPTISFENRFRCADGSYKSLLWTSHPEPETGLLYAAAHDVTELRRVQEQLESTIRASPSADAFTEAQKEILTLRRELEEAKARLRGDA